MRLRELEIFKALMQARTTIGAAALGTVHGRVDQVSGGCR